MVVPAGTPRIQSCFDLFSLFDKFCIRIFEVLNTLFVKVRELVRVIVRSVCLGRHDLGGQDIIWSTDRSRRECFSAELKQRWVDWNLRLIDVFFY